MQQQIPVRYTKQDLLDAERLQGQNWHQLTPEDVTKAITLHRGQGLLNSCTRPADNPGECTVGLANFEFVYEH